MGYLTNLFKTKLSIPKLQIGELLKTSNMANAYTTNNFEKIEKLLKKGKYYYKSVKFKENMNFSLLHQSICDHNRQVIDLILKQSFTKDIDIIEDIDNDIGLAPIHMACLKDNVEIVKDLIEKGHSGLQVKTMNDNLSLIHVSASFGSIRTLEYVHKNYYSKNVDTLSDEKWSALHFACFNNRFDVCSYLIENKADLYLRNRQFLSPIEVTMINDHFDLFLALYNHHYDLNLLNMFDHPESAKLVHIAASCKKGTKILDFLLEDPNNLHEICNSSIKATPLHFACMSDNAIGVRAILRRCPNVNIIDYLGNTPLHYAAERGNLEILRLLMDSDSDALKKNYEGLSPLQIAIHQDNKDIKLFFLGLHKYKNISFKDYM